MEENFTLWNDGHPDHVVHSEEVICGIDAQEDVVCEEVVVEDDVVTETIISDTGLVEEEMTVVQEQEEEIEEEVMYVTGENVIVMPQRQSSQSVVTFQDNFMDCQVTEEIITDDWVNPQSGEERDIIIPVGEVGAEQQIEYDDTEIPLPTDQDEYTASRPYPCDFCSRRFRKKANLMNHMVAHQTDRPHGCNLCGARYIRKCDLMNHLKIHAYVPDGDLLDNDDQAYQDEEPEVEKKRGKKGKKRKGSSGKLKIKEEAGEYEARTSYDYVEEDVRLLNEMEHSVYQEDEEEEEEVAMPEARYPILDPRKPFVCQHCGVAFAREKALASHARIHAGDSPFECETCNEMFWDVTLLREHVRIKHGNTAALESDYEDIDDDDYVDDSKYGDFYCKVCGMRFHRMDLLRRHMRSHEDNIKEELYPVDEEDEYQGHVCNVCGQSFEEALDLLAHAEQHARTGGGNRCMLCGECFTDETQMSTHVMQRHGKNMPQNTCMLCGKTCKDRRTLLKHSWDHSREKLFSCSKCAKSFHNKARLKRHMMSHRNKAVNCDICGEDFPDGRSLMNHRHSHSNVSGRQFPCRECGKSFGSRSSQQIHIRIHTGERPYGCRFCWKAFADGGTLRKHERIHTGEKPYACAVCPRAFNQRVVLREHIRSHHSGPDPNYSNTMTPYCCGVCNDMFSTSQDLIIHLIHHCDLNTAMKRQPQIGPRKYKRRRKLKPHELELISNREDADMYSDQEEKVKRRVIKKPKSPPKTSLEKDYESVFQSFESALQNISSIVNSPPQAKPQSNRGRKKSKSDHSTSVTPRPKMIHTQKTRVPTDDGKRKTKTLITRTQSTETQPKDVKLQQQQQQQNDRIRPRTKNVSYHVLQPDKLPVATFGDAELDPQPDYQNVLIKPDPDRVLESSEQPPQLLEPELQEEEVEMEYEQVETEIPDIANEETILAQEEEIPPPPPAAAAATAAAALAPNPVSIIKVTKAKKNNSLRPGRHIIGPGNKVIRIVKGGLIVKNNNKREHEPETLLPDNPHPHKIKQEVLEPSPLHELAEISMQHAQNQFRCEMCCATFTDRSQLLMHVPIHI